MISARGRYLSLASVLVIASQLDLALAQELADGPEISVREAEADLSDAIAYRNDLKAGNLAGIYSVGPDGSLRCGEIEANPACRPLLEADKADALAEADQMIRDAEGQLVAVLLARRDRQAIAEAGPDQR